MKKLSLAAVLMILLTTCVSGHEGSIGLYTSEVAADCDYAPAMFEQFDVYVVYIKSDSGPDGITACEFKLDKSTGAINVVSSAWQQGFVTLGDVESGISVTTQGCYGSGLAVAPLGTIKMFSTTSPLPQAEYIKVVADPFALEPGIWVSRCIYPYAIHEVLGGYFKFVKGSCNTSVEPKSWGAIKALID